jgi:hypothetical protein
LRFSRTSNFSPSSTRPIALTRKACCVIPRLAAVPQCAVSTLSECTEAKEVHDAFASTRRRASSGKRLASTRSVLVPFCTRMPKSGLALKRCTAPGFGGPGILLSKLPTTLPGSSSEASSLQGPETHSRHIGRSIRLYPVQPSEEHCRVACLLTQKRRQPPKSPATTDGTPGAPVRWYLGRQREACISVGIRPI